MPDYVAPGVADFLDRFPEFRDQDDSVVELVLADANALVTSNWLPSLRVMGVLLLTAHILYIENLIAYKTSTTTGITGSRVSGSKIQSQKVGPLSVSYGQTSEFGGTPVVKTDLVSADLSSSPYGLRFLELLHLSEPAAILVV
jgi:hypothetical protein